MHGRTERPVPFQGDLRNLPTALAPLKELPNWVCWQYKWKVNDKGVGSWTKPPYRPDNPQELAETNDPTTWGTYEQALAAFEAGKCGGIGFNLLGTDIAAFDYDKCRDPATGKIAPEIMVYVDRAASYAEVTVSGSGLRVIGYGDGSYVHRNQKLPGTGMRIESYSNAERYITIAGNPLPQAWPHIADIGSEINAVVAELDGLKNGNGKANKFDFDPQDDPGPPAGEDPSEDDYAAHVLPPDPGDAFLDHDLIELIEKGVPPQEDRSAAFHHAVCWLADWGRSADLIERRIAGKPIVPERYAKRLGREIARCLHRRKIKEEAKARDDSTAKAPGTELPQAFELFWHGKDYGRATRSWLVKELIPETGQGLLSGQWGTAKTFAGMDLAAEIMIQGIFAGRDVTRKGGVVFVAAEGANEIPVRLEGLVEQKLRPHMVELGISEKAIAETLDAMPFAWIEDCPNLQDQSNFDRLMATIKQAEKNIREQFNLPLVLIEIDTLNAAANFKDGNDAAEGQRIMNRLGEISRQTGAFVLAVDHFGKMVETGTRGTSAKEAAADVVLALLADRDTAGNISNTRMAVRKLRGGKVGTETAFDLRVVNVRFGETTCVVEWKADRPPSEASVTAKDRWPKSLRIFKAAVETTITNHGKPVRPYGSNDPVKDDDLTVRAVPLDTVRFEFSAAYPAEGSDAKAKAHAKKMAFARAVKQARDKELVCSREIGGIDYLWLVGKDGN